jgi:hypothetical protein
MNMPQTIYVFRCGSTTKYGFTEDRNGSNLPGSECPEGWRLFKTLTINPGDPPRIGIDITEVLAGIGEKGYHLSSAGVTISGP